MVVTAGEWITQKELAERLDLTVRQVRNLGDHGLPRREDGRYPWPDAQKWYIRFKQQEKVQRANVERPNDAERAARTRKLTAEAIARELEIAERQGQLIHIDHHEQVLQDVCDRLAAKCKGLGKYILDVQRATTDIEAGQLLERIGRELLLSFQEEADELEAQLELERENDDAAA